MAEIDNERLLARAKALYAETVYENGRKEDGIAVRFLMRLSLLANATGQLPDDHPLVAEARNALEGKSGMTLDELVASGHDIGVD